MPAAKKIRKKHVALVLAVLVVAGAAALLSSGSSEDNFSGSTDQVVGQLSVLHGETLPIGDPNNEMVEKGFVLTTEEGDLVKVEVPDPEHAHHLIGERVEVTGELDGKVLVAESIDPLPPTVPDQAAALPVKNVAVLLVNFSNDTSQPFTPTQVTNTMTGCSYLGEDCSVNGLYQLMSDGQQTVNAPVFGWYTLPMDNTSCAISTIASQAKAAAQAAGVNIAAYQYYTYIFPRIPSCAWAGLGNLPGQNAWINGSMYLSTIAHELGHDFGVHHSSAWACTQSGVPVTLSDICVHSEYGDPFSDMGGGATSPFDNWHRWVLGFLPDVQTVTTSGTYQLGTSINPPGSAPRALRIARPDGSSFWLEFTHSDPIWNRWPPGTPIETAVAVRVAPLDTHSQTHLLDMTPATASWWDGGLAVGQTFNDQYGVPKTNVQITTLATNPNYATVNIQFPGPPPTTTIAPPTTTLPPTTTVPPTTIPPTTTIPPPPGTITESYDTGDDNNGDGAWSSFKLGQSFVAVGTHPLTRVEVNAFIKGNAAPVTCELYAASPTGLPTGAVLASGTLQGVSVTPGWRSCPMSAQLVGEVKYVLVLRAKGGNGSNAVYWRNDSTTPTYASGSYLRSRSSGAWDATSPNLTRDNLFRVYAS